MTHSSRRRHWPVAWSTLIEPGMWPSNNPDLNPVDYAVPDALQQTAYQYWRFTTVNQLKKAIVAEWGKVWLIAPLVLGCLHDPANVQHQHVYFKYICWKFAGRLLDRVNTLLVASPASMRRPAARRTHWTFDVKTVRCNFLDNNWDYKHVGFVVDFLKCVVTKVVLFLIVILQTLIFHKVKVTDFGCGGIYSDSFIANCLLILSVRAFWKSVNI